MHTPRTSGFDIDPSRTIEELNKLQPFDVNESEKPRPEPGDLKELKKQLSASMHNAALKAMEKP
jgi:hypothetical protein